MRKAGLAVALLTMLAGCATSGAQTQGVERDAYGRAIVR